MKMTKIVLISTLGVLLSACSPTQRQNEAPTAAVPDTGPAHIHNVEGFGDFTHQHQGDSTQTHGHSWEQLQNEIKNQ